MSNDANGNTVDPELKAVADSNPELIAEAKRILGLREWPHTYKLSVPVQFGKELVEELTFQKGTFGVLKGLGISMDREPTVDQVMAIGAKLCERPLGLIERLDPDDADEVVAIARGFFGRCRGAGKKLSRL